MFLQRPLCIRREAFFEKTFDVPIYDGLLGSTAMELSMELQPGSGRHLYEQIYEHIREEIRAGKLLAGEKLPSTRQLAANLKIARTTVELAYEQLEEEGYLVIRRGSGAYVCETQNIPGVTEKGEKSATRSVDQNGQTPAKSPVLQENSKQDATIDFSPRTIDMSMFPYATWRRILRGILTGDRADLFRRGDPQGDPELRTTIAHYLHLSRGCHCDPEQIVIGAGNDYLMMLLGVLLGGRFAEEDQRSCALRPDRGNGCPPPDGRKEESIEAEEKLREPGENGRLPVWDDLRIGMESPTYLRAAQVMQAMGFSVEPVRSDDGGMCTDALERSGCRLAYLMPARQFPTGTVMSYPRRTELLSWAAAGEDRYLIEDDYDSEFKYRGRPVPSLQSMDGGGHVIYLGTFSKSIAPAIRVSYLILPKNLLEAFHERAGFLSCTVPRLDQAILNEFIQNGFFERYLNRMRNRYRARHDLMLELLKPLEKRFDIRGQGSGLHLVLQLRDTSCAAEEAAGKSTAENQKDIPVPNAKGQEQEAAAEKEQGGQKRIARLEQELAAAARKAGILVYPMSEQNLPQGLPDGQKASPSILLGYAALTEEEIREGVGRLIRVWGT